MIEIGDSIPVEITFVKADEPAPDGMGLRLGFVTVKRLDDHPATQVSGWNLRNGSVQGIPTDDQVVGLRGSVRWVASRGYHGPVWAGRES